MQDELQTPPEQNSAGNGVEMLNTATQQVEVLPPEKAAQAYLSGKYAIDLDSSYELVGIDGGFSMATGGDLKKALLDGYDFANKAQKEERVLKEKYGDNPLNTVEAFAEGAARGLTFGFSDHGLRKLGISQQRLDEIKKRHAWAAGTGELAGIVAPLLATGGTALAARGVAAAGVAPRAVAATGRAAAKATEAAIAKMFVQTGATQAAAKTLARSIFEKAAPSAVGSAVEGAFYGAGQLVSEAALGKADVNAENIISHVGLGALVGGGVGAMLPIPGVLARRVVGEIDTTAAKIAGKTGEEVAEKVDDLTTAASPDDVKIAKIGNVAPEDVAYFKANKDRIQQNIKTATLDESAPSRLSDQVLDDLDKFDDHLRSREQQAGDLIESSGFALPERDVLDIFNSKIAEIKASGKKGTESGIAAMKRLRGYVVRNKSKTGDDIWDAGRIRQFMQGLWEDNRKFYVPGREALFEERAIADVAAKLNETIKSGVGNDYRALMEVYAPEVQAMQRLRKEWKLTNENVPQMQGWFKNRFQYHLQQKIEGARQEIDPIIKAIKTMGGAVGKDYEQVVKDNLVWGRLFPDQAKGLQKGSLTHAVGRLVGGALQGDIKQTLQNLAFQGGKDATGAIRQTVFQDLLSGTPSLFSRAVGGAYESVVVNKLGAMERILKTQRDKISSGVDDFLTKSKFNKVAAPVVAKSLLEVSFGDDERSPKDRVQALKMRTAELNMITANPQMLIDKVVERVGGISQAAPETANAMITTAIKAVQFLQSKAPKPPDFEDSILPDDYDWQPSDDELSQYERYVRAANDPMTVVDDMRQGRLTMEGVETLKAIYPNVYDQVLEQIKTKVAEKGNRLPYAKKLQLEYLFGTSLDFSTKPQAVMMLQSSYTTQQEPPAQGPKPLTASQNALTDTQRVIYRR